MIEELEKMSDAQLETIVIKGDNLNIPNSRASTAKRILEYRRTPRYVIPNLEIPLKTFDTILNNVRAANASLSTVANVARDINNIAGTLATIGSAQQTAVKNVNNMLSSLKSVQQIAGTTMWQEIVNNAVNSHMEDVVNNIRQINLPQIPSEITEPTRIIPKKLGEEITSANTQKSDNIYNFPAYKYIFNLEVYLRTFISEHIIEPNKKQLASKIPQTMLDAWEEKKNAEERNKHVDHTGYDLIEYSDFTDIKTILEKTSTVVLLKDIISEENLKTITSKLIELEPIRLKIAHSRALTKEEFSTLEMYSEKITKILPK